MPCQVHCGPSLRGNFLLRHDVVSHVTLMVLEISGINSPVDSVNTIYHPKTVVVWWFGISEASIQYGNTVATL